MKTGQEDAVDKKRGGAYPKDMTKTIVFGAIAASVLATQALAQGYGTPTAAPMPIKETRKEIREEMKENRMEAREERKENRKEAMEDRKGMRAEMKEKREATREEFKAKVKTIKDARKKETVERVDRKIAALNKNQTARLGEHLDKIAEVLGRIVTRTGTAKTAGKDVAGVETLIAAAQNAATAARATVTAQTAKVYALTITDEKTLRAEAERVRELLRIDLETARNAVKAARVAAHAAAEALGKL